MRLISILALTLGLFACRSSNNNPTIDSPGVAGAVKIQDVQSDSMAPGTAVSLQGVVVTAVDTFGAKTGDIWVEEPEGGAFSGVHVYNAPVAVVATLNVGDIINISGAMKDEFALTGSGTADTTGRTETELAPVTGGAMTVTKTGTGTVPAPAVVDALAIGQMYDASMASTTGGGTAFSNAWRMWQGVLVTTANVTAGSAPKSFGSTTPTPADSYDFAITGVAKVEGSLVDITSDSIARNSCLTVTGVVSYFYDYLIYPRSAADLGTAGPAGAPCPLPEAVCGDNVDNDGNGFTDCADDNCIVTAAACHMTSSINALDLLADATPASPALPTEAVSITNACVTAAAGSDVWVQTGTGAASADNGLLVFGSGVPSGVIAGTTIDFVGPATSFKASGSTAPEGTLEVGQLSITKDVATCTPTPVTLTSNMATLATDGSGHKYIGSLVTLTPTVTAGSTFKVATALANTTAGHFGTLTEGSANTTIAFGSTLTTALSTTPDAAGICFSSITGIWTYDSNHAGSYEILPTVRPTPVTCN